MSSHPVAKWLALAVPVAALLLPGLRERIAAACWTVEQWWGRHVTQRELIRQLDRARLATAPDPTPNEIDAGLRRIAASVARQQPSNPPQEP
ncbi:hypothetical protein [Streptomyces boninensis]|uniref:hypothetical protein n=1 Tax=Streptomyces boninensis TaxID=2039455 RepID=UPI003B21949A